VSECVRLRNGVKAVASILAVNVASLLLLSALTEVFFPERRQVSDAFVLGYLTSAIVVLLTLYLSVKGGGK